MTTDSTDSNSLHQRMGEVLYSLRALSETIQLRDAQSEKLYDMVRADLATLRQDQRDLEEKLDCVICVMQHDLEALRSGAGDNVRSGQQLMRAIQELQTPVSEILALRSRVAGVVLALGVIGSITIWLGEPIYRWVVEQYYLRHS